MKNKKIIYSGKNFSLFVGEKVIRAKKVKAEVIKYPHSVGIIPLLDKNKIVLIKQYRFPLEKKIWEIPAGKISKGESPLSGAKRELEEETGYRAKKWKKLLSFYMVPGYSTEYMTLFLAQELDFRGRKLDKDEFIDNPRVFGLEKAKRMIKRGEIKDIKTILSIFLLENEAIN